MRYRVLLLLFCLPFFVYAVPELNQGHIQTLAQEKEACIRQYLSRIQNESDLLNADKIDVYHYDLNLDLDVENEILYGAVTVNARVVGNSLSVVGLNMWEGLTADSVIADMGQPLAHSPPDYNVLEIQFPQSYINGDLVSFTIHYHGKPQESGAHSFDFDVQNDQPMIWSLSEPFGAHSWWPCKDTPADKADSVDVRVTVPNDLIVVSNGSLRSQIVKGDATTWWWHEQYAICTYLVAIAAHPYDVNTDYFIYNDGADSMRIEFYNFLGNYDTHKDDQDKVKDMLAFLSNIYGLYPFIEEKYGHADFLRGGAMEHQTCSFFNTWHEGIFVHELAHQWCGDLITCESFHHIWLHEGFATYSEALWFEHAYPGYTASEYQMESNLYLEEGTIYVEDPENDSIFHSGLTYSKASWVLHMLRHVVGNDMFFDITRQFFGNSEFRYGTVTTGQFRDFCSQLSGIDLTTFFQQWIYEQGYPVYQYWWDWEPLDDGNYRVFGQIKQVQTMGPIFELPLDVTIETQAGDTTFVLQHDQASVDYEYVVSSIPDSVILDKDNWILKEIEFVESLTEVTQDKNIPTEYYLGANYPNPFNPDTRFYFTLPKKNKVQIRIYDVLGRQVRTLLNTEMPAGNHKLTWNGRDDIGVKVPSGVYFYRMTTIASDQTRKMLLLY